MRAIFEGVICSDFTSHLSSSRSGSDDDDDDGMAKTIRHVHISTSSSWLSPPRWGTLNGKDSRAAQNDKEERTGGRSLINPDMEMLAFISSKRRCEAINSY